MGQLPDIAHEFAEEQISFATESKSISCFIIFIHMTAVNSHLWFGQVMTELYSLLDPKISPNYRNKNKKNSEFASSVPALATFYLELTADTKDIENEYKKILKVAPEFHRHTLHSSVPRSIQD